MQFTYKYVKIFDLLFNGAEECELLDECPQKDFLVITKEYCGRHIYQAYYKDIKLGETMDYISIGFVGDILDTIRGKGIFMWYDLYTGAEYRPYTKEEYKTISKLGLMVF